MLALKSEESSKETSTPYQKKFKVKLLFLMEISNFITNDHHDLNKDFETFLSSFGINRFLLFHSDDGIIWHLAS